MEFNLGIYLNLMLTSCLLASVCFSYESVALEQGEQMERICETYKLQGNTPSGAQIATELLGLTNYYRLKSLRCMLPDQSFIIPIEDQIDIVGTHSTPGYRANMIKILSPMLPTNQPAHLTTKLIYGLDGYERRMAIKSISEKIAWNLSSKDLELILGPIMPENHPDWDGTLESYSYSDHRSALCAVSSHLVDSISADEASELLGLSRDRQRFEILKCIQQKIESELSWNDVSVILGSSVSSRGSIIDQLGEKTPDGKNEKILEKFHERYRSDRFLADPDPPAWLNGQCIAWARLGFHQVSNRPLNLQFGAAKNIPKLSEGAGFTVERDPVNAEVGALIVWNDGGAGHVGIVTRVKRDKDSGKIDQIFVSEANWATASNLGISRWGITLERARAEYVTDSYGRFKIRSFNTKDLDRPSPGQRELKTYKFIGYVLPG